MEFGETNTQLASMMQYRFNKKDWYTSIGLKHFYVVENEELDEEASQSDAEKEDATRMLSLNIESDGRLTASFGSTLG